MTDLRPCPLLAYAHRTDSPAPRMASDRHWADSGRDLALAYAAPGRDSGRAGRQVRSFRCVRYADVLVRAARCAPAYAARLRDRLRRTRCRTGVRTAPDRLSSVRGRG